MDPEGQLGTVQGHSGSIKVWCVYLWRFLESLMRKPTSFNAIRYEEFLGDHLCPLMLFCYPYSNEVSQQVNCTSLKYRLTTSWLDDIHLTFFVIIWPPRSPDLNPIEHIWDVLEQDVAGDHAAPMSHTEL
ncbi:transposable element Tcb2 transposase [Trichonephila clavipes]|nr:transposable element Tcb2 transposase [Trichonephila clavipes]